MPDIIACQSCGSKLKLPDNLGGRKARCPRCGGLVSVKAGLSARVEPPPGPKPEPFEKPAQPEREELDHPELQEEEKGDPEKEEKPKKKKKKKKRAKKRSS